MAQATDIHGCAFDLPLQHELLSKLNSGRRFQGILFIFGLC